MVAFAKIRKDEPLQQDITENSSITWGDFNSLNWKINATFGSFFLFVAYEIYTNYKKSKETTQADIREIKIMIAGFKSELDNRPTWKELRSHDR